MSDKRYHTMRWRRRAKAQLDSEPRCQPCLATGRLTPATVADHITQWHLAADPDREFWTAPLQSCCAQCHNAKRQAERYGKAWKPKTATGADGLPTDPSHPWYGG